MSNSSAHTQFPSGVLTGQSAYELLAYAQSAHFAIPAINAVGSSSIAAILEGAAETNSPIIIQFSYSGAAFIAGKGLENHSHQASIVGACAGAQLVHQLAKHYGVTALVHSDHAPKAHLGWVDGMLKADIAYYSAQGRPLFSSHMIDLSTCSLEENIAISCEYLKHFKPLQLILEVEIGCTGGEEDGIDNQHLSRDKLYTSPEAALQLYDSLNAISPYFTVAASFGNVHGVYAPGNVELKPSILQACQTAIAQKHQTAHLLPLKLVFHGSSGSSETALKEAIQYGVVKVNIDTDVQWAAWNGVLLYYRQNEAYLQGQLGNPLGAEKPNKAFYDPRAWQRASQRSIVERVKSACVMLNSAGKMG